MAMHVNKLAISFLLVPELEPVDSCDEGMHSELSVLPGHRRATSDCGSATSTLVDEARRQNAGQQGRYQCKVCSMQFQYRAKMLYHARSHGNQGPKLHVCDECELAFPKRCLLNNHVKGVHLKERSHRCLQCPRAFFDKKDLAKHVASVHQGLRPHPCPTCGKHFSMAQHVKRHLRTVHRTTPPQDSASPAGGF